jgi:hypothetical protein
MIEQNTFRNPIRELSGFFSNDMLRETLAPGIIELSEFNPAIPQFQNDII